MTRRCSRIRSAATAFMTVAREACRELRCMVEAINADRAARPFLIASKNCLSLEEGRRIVPRIAAAMKDAGVFGMPMPERPGYSYLLIVDGVSGKPRKAPRHGRC